MQAQRTHPMPSIEGCSDPTGEDVPEKTLELPTPEVRSAYYDLRGRVPDKRRSGQWHACYFIFTHEALERMAWSTLAYNIEPYVEQALFMGMKSTARNVNNWLGTSALAPLIGGFLADAYLGRFWTICVFAGIYLTGFILMTISVAVPYLQPGCIGEECPHASSQSAFFYTTLYLIAIGTGGVLPCISAFGADQFDDRDPSEKHKKSSYFNWFFFSTGIGLLFAWTALYYAEAETGWQWTFGIPTIAMSIALCTFLLGASVYRYRRPAGSPLTKISQVIVSAVRKRRLTLPSDRSRLYEEHMVPQGMLPWPFEESGTPVTRMKRTESTRRNLCHTDDFSFLDKACVIDTIRVGDRNTKARTVSRWELCTITQVEELKLLLRMVPIWMANLMFNINLHVAQSLFTEQGGAMNTRLGPAFHVPPATMQIIMALVIVVGIPLYDKLFVPFIRRCTNHRQGLTLLQRMGIGMFFSCLTMVAAGLVEWKRLESVKNYDPSDGRDFVPLSIMLLIPQYFLCGVAQVFTVVAQLEFFYDQVPDGMRSLGTAFYFANSGVAFFLKTLLISVVNDVSEKHSTHGRWINIQNLDIGKLDYFYWLLAVMSFIVLIFHVQSSSLYKYKELASEHCPAHFSRSSFEWNPSELGLMQKPALFTRIDSQRVTVTFPIAE